MTRTAAARSIMAELTFDLLGAMIRRCMRHSRRHRQRLKWSRPFQEANGLIDRTAVFDHVQWSRFGDKSGIEGRIFACQIDFTNDSGGGNGGFLGCGIFAGEGMGERKKESGGG